MLFLSIGDHLQEVYLFLLFKYISFNLEDFYIYREIANIEQQISINVSSSFSFSLHKYVTFVKVNELALVKFLVIEFRI